MAILILTPQDSGFVFDLTQGPTWDVFGAWETPDFVRLEAGASAILQLGTGAGDTVTLLGDPSDYLVSRQGTQTVFTHVATSATVRIMVAGTADQVIFDPDASAQGDESVFSLQASSAGVLLGTQVITPTPSAIEGSATPDETTVSLDGRGTISQPYSLDCGTGPLLLTDSAATANTVHVDNFSADDLLQYTHTTLQNVTVSFEGGDSITLMVNANGIISEVTLNGVNPHSALVYDIDSFNALPVGDISVV